MDDNWVRQVAEARAMLLEIIPSPWDLTRFVDSLSKRRNKPIRLMSVNSAALPGVWNPTRGTPCGLWLETDEADYIVYAAGTTPYHKSHIVMHEVGHILFDGDAGSDPTDGLADLLPDIDADTITRVMGRSGFTTDQETRAELFAELMLTHTSPWRDSQPMRSFFSGES